MQPWSKITHYAGFDWAHDHHEVVIANPSWSRALSTTEPPCVDRGEGLVDFRAEFLGASCLPCFRQRAPKAIANAKFPAATKPTMRRSNSSSTTNLYGVVHVMQAALRFRMLILHLA